VCVCVRARVRVCTRGCVRERESESEWGIASSRAVYVCVRYFWLVTFTYKVVVAWNPVVSLGVSLYLTVK
jgi:hypothetical protein